MILTRFEWIAVSVFAYFVAAAPWVAIAALIITVPTH